MTDEMGAEWARCHRVALGAASGGDAELASLRLFLLSCEDVAPLLDPRQSAVADRAMQAARSAIGDTG